MECHQQDAHAAVGHGCLRGVPDAESALLESVFPVAGHECILAAFMDFFGEHRNGLLVNGPERFRRDPGNPFARFHNIRRR
jgi:hypothetical protein